jgi:hypothetical protein
LYGPSAELAFDAFQKTVLFDELAYIALAACKFDIRKTMRTLDKIVEILPSK